MLCASVLCPAAARAATLTTVAGCESARLDRGAGVARSLSACGRADLALGAEGAARQALGRVAGALGVRRDTRDLGLMSVSPTSAGPRVRFQQFVHGVPVRNGQVAVALDEDGDVVHVGNGAVGPARLATRPIVGRATAILTARRRVPSGFDTVSAPTARLVAEPRGSGALELAWHVLVPVRAPRGDWNVVVSARSGDVLTAFDGLRRIDGSALTYAPNPVQQTGNTDLNDGAGRRRHQPNRAHGGAHPAHADRSRPGDQAHRHLRGHRLGRRRRMRAALHPRPGQQRNARVQLHPRR